MPELQDIFQLSKPAHLSPSQYKAFSAIQHCRTDNLGSHADHCNSCGNTEFSYNSCRNRHCPKCQGSKQAEWIEAQAQKLLPLSYFHIVFTLPNQLNTLVYQNQKLVYSLFMKCAAETLKELALDPKNLGAQIGITAILHTWGQNLCFHPHVHCIVPGGGLSFDGCRLIRSKKNFFIHVKEISKKFKGKFLDHLKKIYYKGHLKFFGEARELVYELQFLNLISDVQAKNWVVYCKDTLASPEHVIKYLGRYTHRVAITNSRILKVTDTDVTFRWKDYKDGYKIKEMTLSIPEFIRRFLLHVLPSGFSKIRHYGILSSPNVKTKLLRCMRLAAVFLPFIPQTDKPKKVCSVCGAPTVFAGICARFASSP